MVYKKSEKNELAERPKGERTPYKYGGSLGWVASMIDPETSSWNPMRLRKNEPAQPGPHESDEAEGSSS